MVQESWVEVNCYMSLYAKINVHMERMKANSSTSVFEFASYHCYYFHKKRIKIEKVTTCTVLEEEEREKRI